MALLYGVLVRCSVNKTENVKSQSFPGRLGCTAVRGVQDLRYGPIPSHP